jgi:uncharacterized protein YhaN
MSLSLQDMHWLHQQFCGVRDLWLPAGQIPALNNKIADQAAEIAALQDEIDRLHKLLEGHQAAGQEALEEIDRLVDALEKIREIDEDNFDWRYSREELAKIAWQAIRRHIYGEVVDETMA